MYLLKNPEALQNEDDDDGAGNGGLTMFVPGKQVVTDYVQASDDEGGDDEDHLLKLISGQADINNLDDLSEGDIEEAERLLALDLDAVDYEENQSPDKNQENDSINSDQLDEVICQIDSDILNISTASLLSLEDKKSKEKAKKCVQCLKKCDYSFCVNEKLVAGHEGDYEGGIYFAGKDVWKIKDIISVKEVFERFRPVFEEK